VVSTPSTYLDPAQQALIEASRSRLGSSLERRDRSWWARWSSAVGFVVIALSFVLLLPTQRALDVELAVVLTAGYAVASRIQFEVGSGAAIPTELVFAAMLFTLPGRAIPLAIGAAMVLSRAPELLRQAESFSSLAATVGSGWFSIGPVALVVALHEPSASSGRWPLLFLLVLVQTASDFASTAAREWWALRVRPAELLAPMTLVFGVDAVLAPIGFLAAMSGTSTSLVASLLPLSLIARFASERRTAIDQALELGRAYRGTALLLGDVVEADDAYTGSHSRDVVELSLAVSDRLGLEIRDRQAVELVALLHDVGKIKIPNEIIRKDGPLTPDERTLIETHTIEGEKLLLTVGGFLGEVGHLVRSCHERWDGTGYPDRLAGTEIPLVARIICCCDAFNAMTTDRPYRKARTLEEAAEEVERSSGTHFDPSVVAALLQLVRSGTH
jgi:HD-GYP domain-containing protein (c-di-GMP phosphodiesterase class II)